MVHGLLWLPLLIFFFWITWAGWNEYQKVETYKQWANQFERAKYDICAALGQSDRTLTWGLPTRGGIVDLQSVDLDRVHTLNLLLKTDEQFARVGAAKKGDAVIQLTLENGDIASIPFTNVEIAQQWHDFLGQRLEANVG